MTYLSKTKRYLIQEDSLLDILYVIKKCIEASKKHVRSRHHEEERHHDITPLVLRMPHKLDTFYYI